MTKAKLTKDQILQALSMPFTSIHCETLYMTDRIKQEIFENFEKCGFVKINIDRT